jgi:hypothetical protein
MGYNNCLEKVRYATEEFAIKVKNKREWNEKLEGNVIKLRVYPCILGAHPCGGWHITKSLLQSSLAIK